MTLDGNTLTQGCTLSTPYPVTYFGATLELADFLAGEYEGTELGDRLSVFVDDES